MGDIFAYVSETDIYKDRKKQISVIKKLFPSIKEENVWGQGRKRYASCDDIRYILQHALRSGDTFVVSHLFQISVRRDAILDTIIRFHEAKVQLVIIDIGYQDLCAAEHPKSSHFHLYSRILNAYADLQSFRSEQKEEDRIRRIIKKQEPKGLKRGHPEKQFADYDQEIQSKVKYYVEMQGTKYGITMKEVLKELQENHKISMPTLKRIVKKYKENSVHTKK